MTSADPPPLVGDRWPSPRTGGTLFAVTNSLDLANRVVEASHHIATNADRVQRVLAAQGAGI